MAVVTNPTALTEATYGTGPIGSSQAAEQNGDATNGNKTLLAPGKYLIARNTTAGAIGIDIYADLNGSEVKLVDGSVAANKVGANAVRTYGPFPPALYQDHTTSVASANGNLVFKQQSGIAGDVKYSPMQLDRG